MIGEMIKEYLVGLGVQIDKPGFAEMDSTIKTTTNVIETATGAWAANFVKASGIIVTAIASVTTAVAGLMKSTAQQDLEMEKFARRMMLTKDAAWEMKKATDALGESVSDIVITPELMDRYKTLVQDGRQMRIGGDFRETMKSFRDLTFEFTRLKQEVSYAMSWVGYYLIKYLNRPLQEAQEKFKSFNDSFIRNMSVWTEKVARALVYIINIGIHLFDFIKSVTSSIYKMWEAFPRGVKIATVAVLGFFAVLRASPFGRMIMLVSTLLLLIDDYFGYMEGKQAQFGKYWDKLNGFIDTAKTKITELKNYLFGLVNEVQNSKAFNDFLTIVKRLAAAFKNLAAGVIDTVSSLIKNFYEAMTDTGTGKDFKNLLLNLWDIFSGLLDTVAYCIDIIGDWLNELSRSETVKDLVNAVVELVNAFLELCDAVLYLCKTALREFFDGMQQTQHIYTFRDAVSAAVKVLSMMIRIIATVMRYLAKFLKMMANNRLLREFWNGLGKAVRTFSDIINDVITTALKSIGKLGRALLKLVKGDFKGAAREVGSIFSSGGAGNVGEPSDDATSERAQYVYKRLLDKGYSPEQVAGIVGNLVWESHLDTTARSSDGYNSVGIGQWTFEREQALYDYAKNTGRDPFDLDTQIDFLDYELNNKESFAKETLLANSSSPERAAEVFSTGTNGRGYGGFERPDPAYAYNDTRMANARAIYDHMLNTKFPNNPTQKSGWALPSDWLKMLNPDLLEKFNDFLHAIEKYGYGFNFKGAGTDWAGIGITGNPDIQNIKDMAALYGLIASKDAQGYYFSLSGGQSVNDVPEENGLFTTIREKIGSVFSSTNFVGRADPYLYNSLMSGGYAASYVGGNNTYYTINVGGVNVANTNANPQEIGQAVADVTLNRLNNQARYIQQSKSTSGMWG